MKLLPHSCSFLQAGARCIRLKAAHNRINTMEKTKEGTEEACSDHLQFQVVVDKVEESRAAHMASGKNNGRSLADLCRRCLKTPRIPHNTGQAL